MDKRALIIFIVVGLLIVSAAGYFGFQTTQEPQAAVEAPQTVTAEICDVEQTVTAPGSLVNVDLANVNMPTTGKLSSVGVRVGDAVLKGQTLAELDDVAKSQAQLAFVEAQEELSTAERNRVAMDYPRATEAFIKEYKQKIKYQKQKIGLLSDKYNNAVGSEAKASALMELSNAQTELSTMNTNLNWYLGHPSDDDIANSDSTLAVAKAKYNAAKAVLDSLAIIAPFDGVILEANAELGVTINAEKTLFKIGNPKALEVEANITEEDFPVVSVGQEVDLFFDARSDMTITGRLDRIIPIRIEGDSPRYHIYITLDNVPDGLADGMTADASITITKRENVICLPRSIVRASGVDNVTLKIWNGTAEESREVTVGLRGDSDVEIISGLQVGDQVVIQ
ncbi:MAG: efflux RND transporter periplasmic adaptor subunit [Anaerolineales bacterium]|nr:efflux RND transporter periplasmic adaptor subunit [Anaerolineales bacterium]